MAGQLGLSPPSVTTFPMLRLFFTCFMSGIYSISHLQQPFELQHHKQWPCLQFPRPPPLPLTLPLQLSVHELSVHLRPSRWRRRQRRQRWAARLLPAAAALPAGAQGCVTAAVAAPVDGHAIT